MRFGGPWPSLTLALTLVSCGVDGKSAAVQVPSWPLAVGFYSHANIIDTGSFSTRQVGAVTSANTSDGSIVAVARNSDAPADFAAFLPSPDQVFLKALAPGETQLHIEANFGSSKRSAQSALRARKVDAITITPMCDANADLPYSTFAGALYSFKVGLAGAGQQLSGYQSDVVKGSGIQCSPSSLESGLNDSAGCLWLSPATAGTLALSSPYNTAFAVQLTAYSVADVAGVGTDLVTGAFAAIPTPGHTGTFGSYAKLSGGRPCQTLPMQAKALTPTVCSGLGGESTWVSDRLGVITYQALATGDCSIGVGVNGSNTYPATVKFKIPAATN